MAAPDAGHSAVFEEWFGELVKILLAVPTALALHRWAVGDGADATRRAIGPADGHPQSGGLALEQALAPARS